MISMIWISQTALRFADTDLFATILFSLFLMWIVLSFKGDEERGVTGLFHYLIAGFFYFYTSAKFWKKTSEPQVESKAVNPKKENKKPKETLPPVLAENPRRKQKKGRRNQKKSFCKENTDPPPAAKKETKMFSSWNYCEKLNRDPKSIYDYLFQFILTDIQLRMNHFPREGFKPWTQVAADDSNRKCVRCGKIFTIYNGLYLSDSQCHYHPRKATYVSGTKLYGCCNSPYGSPACTVFNNHVTQQHGPRPLTRTSSRRHVRRDLQYSIFSLDCEMCYTTEGLEVVRVGLVNMEGLALYDGFVKPRGKILDYNTQYSGVDQTHLQNVSVTLDDVKEILSGYVHEGTILVGHALNNDLSALGLIHGTIVDTSVLYADPRIPSKKTALKTLASDYLGITIQDSATGHDCIDDARATLQLALLKVPAVPVEQTQHQSAQKQEAGTCLNYSRHEQQQPLGEIQNLGRFNPGAYGVWGGPVDLPRLYVNQSNCFFQGLCDTPPWPREGY